MVCEHCGQSEGHYILCPVVNLSEPLGTTERKLTTALDNLSKQVRSLEIQVEEIWKISDDYDSDYAVAALDKINVIASKMLGKG